MINTYTNKINILFILYVIRKTNMASIMDIPLILSLRICGKGHL